MRVDRRSRHAGCAVCAVQEREAAKARAEADKKKARLAADVDRLRGRLQNLADQAAAKQEEVRLQLQKRKMEKELDIQVGCDNCGVVCRLGREALSAWLTCCMQLNHHHRTADNVE